MIKLNRTTEYGLMALRHMSRRQSSQPFLVTSAREIAEYYGLPFEITAKTLQRLKDSGLIESAQGAKGGYTLRCSLKKVSLAEFLDRMEGAQSVVACSSLKAHDLNECEYAGKCEIPTFMNELNTRIYKFLSSISLAEVVEGSQVQMTLTGVRVAQAVEVGTGRE